MKDCGCGPGERYWTAKRTYTSNCGEPKCGSYTAVVTACSAISLEHAQEVALERAKYIAESSLVCGWCAEVTATGVCGHQETRTAFSIISYADAYANAQALALQAANQWCVAHTVSYSSTRSATASASCAGGSCGNSVSITLSRTAYSMISQAAADALAQAAADSAAQEAANAALDCSAQVYYSTQTVTLYCPEGTSGGPSSGTADGSGCDQGTADNAAYNAAYAIAESGLDCQPIEYTSTQSYTASCPEGYTGNPVTATETSTSMISQAAADAAAAQAAMDAAISALHCDPQIYYGTAQVTITCNDGITQVTGYGTGTGYSQGEADNNAVIDAQNNAQAQCPP